MNEAINALHRSEKTILYGHDKTWHSTEYIDVETDPKGRVVSVWFRCMLLPFKQSPVSGQRVKDMDKAYTEGHIRPLLAVEVADEE